MRGDIFIFLFTPLVAAASQLMLKKAADNPRNKGLRVYLNPLVILAYTLFLGCMLLNVLAYRTLELTLTSVLEASGYLYVVVLSHVFLKERITPRKLLGNALIIVGIVLALTL